jgi:hypothetical protein
VPTYNFRNPSAHVPPKLHPVRGSLLFLRQITAKPVRQKSFQLQGPAPSLTDPRLVATPPGVPHRVPSEIARACVARNLLLVGCTSGLEVDISELLWAVCRASRAPLPEHAMDIRHSQGVLPTVLARRTPRGPPSQPPEQPPEPGCAGGHFLEVQGYPRGAQQRPLLETTVPSTIGSGLGAPCGGRRRPGTCVHQRGEARRRLAENLKAGSTGRSAGAPLLRGLVGTGCSPWTLTMGLGCWLGQGGRGEGGAGPRPSFWALRQKS